MFIQDLPSDKGVVLQKVTQHSFLLLFSSGSSQHVTGLHHFSLQTTAEQEVKDPQFTSLLTSAVHVVEHMTGSSIESGYTAGTTGYPTTKLNEQIHSIGPQRQNSEIVYPKSQSFTTLSIERPDKSELHVFICSTPTSQKTICCKLWTSNTIEVANTATEYHGRLFFLCCGLLLEALS